MLAYPMEEAYKIAKKAHAGQVDKGDNPYILHPLTVSSMVKAVAEKTIAILHDVCEDSKITCEELKGIGFSGEVLEAVKALTKAKGEPDEKYLNRVRHNRLATIVKIADLRHNSDLTRIPKITDEDIKRRDKYQAQIEYLSSNKI